MRGSSHAEVGTDTENTSPRGCRRGVSAMVSPTSGINATRISIIACTSLFNIFDSLLLPPRLRLRPPSFVRRRQRAAQSGKLHHGF